MHTERNLLYSTGFGGLQECTTLIAVHLWRAAPAHKCCRKNYVLSMQSLAASARI